MLRKFLFVITTCFIATASFACTCMEHIESFNLVDYENYDNIFEVKIESSFSPDIEDSESDTLDIIITFSNVL